MACHEVVADGDVIFAFRNPQPAFNLTAAGVDEYSLHVCDHYNETIEQVDGIVVPHSDDLKKDSEVEIEPESIKSEAEATSEGFQPRPDSPIEEIRVSSMHLIVASPYFRRALKSHWKEGTLLRDQGFVRMDQKDGDLEAVVILMNIIHGRVRSVPKTLSLEMLARIAVYVDYYECHEAVENFTDMWIANLRGSLPKEFSRDVILWICISSVFQQPTEFQASTSLALKYSRGPVKTLGLPMLSKVTDTIEEQRQHALKRLIRAMHKLVQDLYQDLHGCSHECRLMLLGALTRELHAQKIFDPVPSRPFLGLNFATTSKSIRDMRSPEWYGKAGIYQRVEIHNCNLKSEITAIIDSLETFMKGLKMTTIS